MLQCAASRNLFYSDVKLAVSDASTIFCSAIADLDFLPLSTAFIISNFFASDIDW